MLKKLKLHIFDVTTPKLVLMGSQGCWFWWIYTGRKNGELHTSGLKKVIRLRAVRLWCAAKHKNGVPHAVLKFSRTPSGAQPVIQRASYHTKWQAARRFKFCFTYYKLVCDPSYTVALQSRALGGEYISREICRPMSTYLTTYFTPLPVRETVMQQCTTVHLL